MSTDHIAESDGAADAAIGYSDDFLHAAVSSIDAIFGEGYAKDNPVLVGQYMTASATNLSSFMQAAMAMQSSGLGEMLAALGEEGEDDLDIESLLTPAPKSATKPRKKN